MAATFVVVSATFERSDVERAGPARLLIGAVVAIMAGLVIAVLPAWLVLPFGPRYQDGEACLYEHDPGSGYSGTGAAEIRWGLVPGWACRPVGPLDMAHSGPEFRAAVAAALQSPESGGALSADELWVLDGNVVMGSLDLVWPFMAVLIPVMWLTPTFIAAATRRSAGTVRRTYLISGSLAVGIGVLYVAVVALTRDAW